MLLQRLKAAESELRAYKAKVGPIDRHSPLRRNYLGNIVANKPAPQERIVNGTKGSPKVAQSTASPLRESNISAKDKTPVASSRTSTTPKVKVTAASPSNEDKEVKVSSPCSSTVSDPDSWSVMNDSKENLLL